MQTLSFGFKKPAVKDQGPIVFPAIEANWQQVNDHNHNGINSSLINSTTLLPSQIGNIGKFLTTDGATVSWATIVITGEVNTASNLAGGNGIFKQKTGVDLEFKPLVAGANMTITPVGDTLVFAASGGGGGFNVLFRAHINTLLGASIADGVYQPVIYGGVDYDTAAGYNALTGEYTIPVGQSGYYEVKAAYVYTYLGSTNNFRGMAIAANGVVKSQERLERGNVFFESPRPFVSDILYFNAGDIITACGIQNSGGPIAPLADANIFLEAFFSLRRVG